MSRGGVKELKVLIASERTSTLENDENLATMNKKGDSGLNVSSHGSQAAISSIGKCRQIESSVLKHMKELQELKKNLKNISGTERDAREKMVYRP